jgi:prepilin-type N-terminal cleavage/methylation domain-containing protein
VSTVRPTSRPGFTLIEVALVTVLGLVIMAGTVTAYYSNKAQAAGAEARRRIQAGQTVIEEFAAANHAYPVSGGGQFTAMWAKGHPEEAARSPWGGAPGLPEGAVEDAPYTDGTADPAAAPDKTASRPVDGSRHGCLHYTSIDGSAHVKVTTRYAGETRTFRAYVLAIYDSTGNPWFDAAGASK